MVAHTRLEVLTSEMYLVELRRKVCLRHMRSWLPIAQGGHFAWLRNTCVPCCHSLRLNHLSFWLWSNVALNVRLAQKPKLMKSSLAVIILISPL